MSLTGSCAPSSWSPRGALRRCALKAAEQSRACGTALSRRRPLSGRDAYVRLAIVALLCGLTTVSSPDSFPSRLPRRHQTVAGCRGIFVHALRTGYARLMQTESESRIGERRHQERSLSHDVTCDLYVSGQPRWRKERPALARLSTVLHGWR